MVVSLAGRLGVGLFNRVRSRWNDDPCACTVTQNSVVGWVAIIGSIGRELADLIIDLIQQRLQLRGMKYSWTPALITRIQRSRCTTKALFLRIDGCARSYCTG